MAGTSYMSVISDDVCFVLDQHHIFIYLDMPFWVIVSNTLNVKEILGIYLIEQKIYPNHGEE
jgi:hypothetical protein